MHWFFLFFGSSFFFQNYIFLVLISSASTNPVTISDATTHKDFGEFSDSNNFHFQTINFLNQWEDTQNIILIGSLNYVYMLDASTKSSNRSLPYTERLQWVADRNRVETCKLIPKPENECHNYIKVVQKLGNGVLYICGTNAHKPSCRFYTKEQFHSSNFNGSAHYLEDKCLYSCGVSYTPQASTMMLHAKTSHGYRYVMAINGQLFGKKSSFLTNKNFIPIFSHRSWFNEAIFVKIVKFQNKAYLFFRETATSVETGNSPTVYGRVAQVCLNDIGATRIIGNSWITFLKARLKCLLPSTEEDQNELTLNNLVSVSDVVDVVIDNKITKAAFAIFTTPKSWSFLSSSAVCMFTMESIQNLFKAGDFYGEKVVSPEVSVKFRVEDSIPNPRPGACLSDGAYDQISTLEFIRFHKLMYDSISAFQDAPIFVSDSNLTKVTVDSKAGKSNQTIIYVSTNDGRILRIRPTLDESFELKKVRNHSVFLEQMHIMEKSKCKEGSCTVHALQLYKPENNSKRPFLFVAYDDKVIRTPLSICKTYTAVSCCSVNPECGWKNGECVERISDNFPLPNVEDSKDILKLCLEKGTGGGVKDEDPPSTILSQILGGLFALIPFVIVVGFLQAKIFKTIFSKHKKRSTRQTEQENSLTELSFSNTSVSDNQADLYSAFPTSTSTAMASHSTMEDSRESDIGSSSTRYDSLRPFRSPSVTHLRGSS